MKPWIANLSFIVVEIIMIGAAFIIGADAIKCLFDGDFSGYMYGMSDLINYVSILNVLIVIISILFLVVKPLRTKFTRFWSILNILWVIIQMGFMYLNN